MNRIQKQIVLDALDNEHLLSESEVDFINQIAEYDDDRELTKAQNSWLNKIGSRIAES